ncbi:MAG: hypothetical protein H0U74_02630 [Bradymonadaceae bacterium]|nr:hypothetical protein [Lujinxingiaceae bacterium]
MALFRRFAYLTLLLLSLAGLILASCGPDEFEIVGAPCELNGHCGANLCLSGPAYPEGTCSVPCRSTAECPSHAICVARDGGVCLPSCSNSRDCRPGYACAPQHNLGRSGTDLVCINSGTAAFDVVGTACSRDQDCPGGKCLTGGRYPGGTCTFACDSERDCPNYAGCIDRDGGVCLPYCDSRLDCRPGYNCVNQRRRGHPGGVDVCIDN